MPRDKVILAYSGGLDTSVMVPWIGDKYNLDVVAFTVDLGQGEDIERIRQVFVHGSAAHWTRPPSIGLTPLMRMSTLLRLAPLRAVTVERILVLAATVRSRMSPRPRSTGSRTPRPTSRCGAARARSSASRPAESAKSSRGLTLSGSPAETG